MPGEPPFNASGQPSRKRRRTVSPTVTAIAVVVALAAVVVLLKWGIRTGNAPRCGPEVPCCESLYVTGDTMCQNELFSTMLARMQVPASRINQAYAALKETDFNFRRLRPGDSVTLRYRGLGLEALRYHKDLALSYEVRFDSAGALAGKREEPVDTTRVTVAGEVKESIWHSLVALGEEPWLVMTFTEILRYDVDFFTESNDGDSFQLIAEKLYVGQEFYKYGRVHAVHYAGRTDNTWGFYYKDPRGHWDFYNEKGQSLRKTVLRSPLEFRKVTSHFGMRFHPIHKVYRKHQGVDYGAPSGTPVSCIADGSIEFAGWRGGYGRLVIVKHKSGLSSRYGHLSGFGPGVKSGRRARQGQTIGYVGATGDATGPHLHFEIRKHGTPLNPEKVVPPRADPVLAKYRPEFDRLKAALEAEVAAALAPEPAPADSVPPDSVAGG